MTLTPGPRLGPYEILWPLGAGGMGEVYKARDTRLDRSVAIKVLPEHLAATPDLRTRFEREAKAVSSLNHPHICTLHDIGQQGGTSYLVMEFLDGTTLASRLERGALPLEEALKIAIEVARLLAQAGCDLAVPSGQRCCGALHAHSGDLDGARRLARGLARTAAKPLG